MIHDRRSGLAAFAVAMLVAFALAAAGWAHRLPETVDRDGGAAFAAYVASGGTLADICGSFHDEGPDHKDCPVCRVPGSLPLPTPAKAPRLAAIATAFSLSCIGAQPETARHPAWNGRAPPVV